MTKNDGAKAVNSAYAYRISEAVRQAKPGGDFIDHGWALVNCLHAAGFDIVPRDRGPAGLNPANTLNEMCGLNSETSRDT